MLSIRGLINKFLIIPCNWQKFPTHPDTEHHRVFFNVATSHPDHRNQRYLKIMADVGITLVIPEMKAFRISRTNCHDFLLDCYHTQESWIPSELAARLLTMEKLLLIFALSLPSCRLLLWTHVMSLVMNEENLAALCNCSSGVCGLRLDPPTLPLSVLFPHLNEASSLSLSSQAGCYRPCHLGSSS